MMELHGKVVSPNRTGLDLNGAPEILVADTTRFKLDINLEAPVDFSGTTLYPLTFQAALANLTRTKKVEAVAEPVLNCPAHEIASQELEEKAEAEANADIIEFRSDVIAEVLEEQAEADITEFHSTELVDGTAADPTTEETLG